MTLVLKCSWVSTITSTVMTEITNVMQGKRKNPACQWNTISQWLATSGTSNKTEIKFGNGETTVTISGLLTFLISLLFVIGHKHTTHYHRGKIPYLQLHHPISGFLVALHCTTLGPMLFQIYQLSGKKITKSLLVKFASDTVLQSNQDFLVNGSSQHHVLTYPDIRYTARNQECSYTYRMGEYFGKQRFWRGLMINCLSTMTLSVMWWLRAMLIF